MQFYGIHHGLYSQQTIVIEFGLRQMCTWCDNKMKIDKMKKIENNNNNKSCVSINDERLSNIEWKSV